MKNGRAKAIMVLGTGSGVGKSFITAGLCRILRDAGVRVAPFKAQNMSNNSYVTQEGGEMGRAQVVQAECAGVEPSVHMNPVLLKPEADNGSQVVIHGKAMATLKAREYYGLRDKIFAAIQESYEKLSGEYDALVIEGAGSPAEINLKAFDMVNFRVAEMADARCLLVGDIDRGGVFAWLWGTLALLHEKERRRIAGLVINKFRGDSLLLEPGLRMLENLCGKKVLGVIPYATDLWIEEEDAVFLGNRISRALEGGERGEGLDIAVLLFPRISNATDFQILAEEPGVNVRMIRRIEEFGTPDLLILPGTKSTIEDLRYLKQSGLAARILKFASAGGRVMGICGGFQMLGERITDPESVESGKTSEAGLGLLPVQTQFFPEKILERVKGRAISRVFNETLLGDLTGYEIHMGKTFLSEGTVPLFQITSFDLPGAWRREGCISTSGNILGTYLHGLFDEEGFRTSFLNALWKSAGKKIVGAPLVGALSSDHRAGTRPAPTTLSSIKEKNYNRLANLLRENLDLGFLNLCLKSSLRLP